MCVHPLSELLDLPSYCRSTQEFRLLDAFLSLLERESYADITVLDIVDEAHMSKGAFYQLYGNKSDFAQQVFGIIAAALLAYVTRAIDQEPNAWHKVRAGLAAYVDVCLDYPHASRFLLLSSPGLPSAFDQLRFQAHHAFADMIRSRLLVRETSPEIFAWLAASIVGAVNETVIHALLRAEPLSFQERQHLIGWLNEVIGHALLTAIATRGFEVSLLS